MNRLIAAAVIYLVIALGLEAAVLPAFGESFGVDWSQARLVALGVILVGLIRGEFAALAFALPAAVLAAAAEGPGFVGSTLVGFTIAAFIAGMAPRVASLEMFVLRVVVFFGALALESWASSLTRAIFWSDAAVDIQWGIHFVVACLGAALYPTLRRMLGPRPEDVIPIGVKSDTRRV